MAQSCSESLVGILNDSESAVKDDAQVIYEFSGRRLDPARRQLIYAGKPVAMFPRCFDALLLLVERRGELLDKDFLLAALWPDVVVDENSLAKVISEVRRALGEAPRDSGCIETVPRRGYRFNARVEVQNADAAPYAGGSTSLRAEIRALAVLPFTITNPRANDDTLGLGLADALITRLGQLQRTLLRPSSSVARFAGTGATPTTAGRELGVDTVIAGNLRRAGDTVRVSVQMVAVASDTVTWAEKFDLQSADSLALEDAISERVADALTLALARGERPPAPRRFTANADAYEHYMRGRYLWNKRTRDTLMQAVQSFERAIAIDPDYALAHAGLAIAWIHAGVRAAVSQSFRPREVMPKARAAAEKALALDDTLSEAHAALGQVLFIYEWKREEGMRELRRAMELNPNDQNANHWYAMALAGIGRFDQALLQIQRARDIDPLAVMVHANVGFILYRAGRFQEAVEHLRKTVAIEPTFVMARYRLGLACEGHGLHEEALEQFQAMHPSADDPLAFTAIARTLALMGREQEARRELARLLEIARTTYVPAALIAGISVALGDKDGALEYLERGLEERALTLMWLPFDRDWDSLRGEPRFARLVASIGLKG
jgi:DNA-binding winged helix-turn-helix (wHTH) protein/tetratricopeptide (TPR) repeat protein